MSLKSDALETVIVVGVVALGLWWIERKIASGVSSVGDAISGAFDSMGQGLVNIADTFSPIVASTAGQVPSAVDSIQAGLAPGQVATTGEYDYTSALMGLGN
ncbi:hypothetical protein [Trinickia sp. EG282A]|uniref:hypothetical protein n=1 Tax=Trinickia sp. EG282A TaxID=3237013 RepID=UPI0034D36E04